MNWLKDGINLHPAGIQVKLAAPDGGGGLISDEPTFSNENPVLKGIKKVVDYGKNPGAAKSVVDSSLKNHGSYKLLRH